jgi:hypothetical protein
MYENGSLVTLIMDKSHGEGEDAMRLKSGVCGQVVQQRKRNDDGNHEYVVDFGAYGQWYCYHNELSGEDSGGWDDNAEDNQDGEQPRDNSGIPELLQSIIRPIESGYEEGIKEDPTEAPIIDVERDIKRRMQEIEKGR